ncbi:ATP-binding cassette domain-containing protein [Rhodobacterales bacterium HKCCA1058]|nr:ATP-binding cassette domain-containing protein [Rhodobacterales bacterium HKCCA1058]
MILVMAFLDVLGVASILPLMAVLSNPEIIQTNRILNAAFVNGQHIGIHTPEQFLFALSVSVLVLLVTSLTFKALTTYAQIRFGLSREYTIGERLVEGYLHQPYSWFLNRHSADLGKTILSEVGTVIEGCLLPLITLIAQTIVAVALLVLLIVVDPQLALGAGVVLGLAYTSLFLLMSGWLKRLGQVRVNANKQRYAAVSEAFAAVKEIKVGGLEEVYVERFAEPAETFAKSQATARVIALIPRFALEAIAFGGMLLVVLYLMAKTGSFQSALPIISLYAFAGYRLMPALQQIYEASSRLRFAGPALNALHRDLNSLQAVGAAPSCRKALPLSRAISLNQISYQYPNARQAALKGIDLTIAARSLVGFVGATGSGKTTTVDVILGLFEPQEGALQIDGVPISAANRRSWQRSIGYVPQHIYLADDSVAANIAFGVQASDVSYQALERAAKIANLHEFVVNNLPHGYATTVGERGVRLSGGQRQRIGIARALYHNPQVLILDEATSALDNLTEQVVMDAVNNLDHEITIILVAHRLSTVRQCDQIYLLEQGEVVAQGTFEELSQGNEQFRAMVAGP